MGRGGALVESILFNRRAMGSNHALFATQGPWASPLLAIACGASAWNSGTVSVLSRERFWVGLVVDLKRRLGYRNGQNEWINGELICLPWLLIFSFLFCGPDYDIARATRSFIHVVVVEMPMSCDIHVQHGLPNRSVICSSLKSSLIMPFHRFLVLPYFLSHMLSRCILFWGRPIARRDVISTVFSGRKPNSTWLKNFNFSFTKMFSQITKFPMTPFRSFTKKLKLQTNFHIIT